MTSQFPSPAVSWDSTPSTTSLRTSFAMRRSTRGQERAKRNARKRGTLRFSSISRRTCLTGQCVSRSGTTCRSCSRQISGRISLPRILTFSLRSPILWMGLRSRLMTKTQIARNSRISWRERLLRTICRGNTSVFMIIFCYIGVI